MAMDQDEVDKIIGDTRDRIDRMKALADQTYGLLKRNDNMTEESNKHQALDADAQPEDIPPMDGQIARMLGVAGENGFVADGTFEVGDSPDLAAADEPAGKTAQPCRDEA